MLHIQESDVDQAYAFGEFNRPGPVPVYKDLTLTELFATQGINHKVLLKQKQFTFSEKI